MKKLALGMVLMSVVLFAALPPQHQNIKDLDTLVAFVKQHPKVAATIREIDVVNRTIRFGAGCKAIFRRKVNTKSSGMVGPAEPLELKRTTCPLDQ